MLVARRNLDVARKEIREARIFNKVSACCPKFIKLDLMLEVVVR